MAGLYESGAPGVGRMKAADAPGPAEPPSAWQDYVELKQLLRALGDVVRLNILHALSTGDEVKVTDLAVRLAVSQPLVSWNLTVLRHAGLVRRRRQGREVYCSLDRDRFEECMRLLASVVQPAEAEASAPERQTLASKRAEVEQAQAPQGKASDLRAPRSPPPARGP
jgi:ArsR family transcriptional regulator